VHALRQAGNQSIALPISWRALPLSPHMCIPLCQGVRPG
jgi:hypothetical protein